ncbi:hypothetical protein BC829DRAFT_43364 [Chytridium lagenaria]|nr:hypothetical protein BC829DRAFT_43364 [Chytridium lagenaria]
MPFLMHGIASFGLTLLNGRQRIWLASLKMDLAREESPPFLSIFMHIVFNTCRLMLHRPRMMEAIRRCHSNAKYDVDFKICDVVTLETARILIEVVLPEPKIFLHMSSFLPFFLFQSCLSHIMIAQVPNFDRIMHNGCFRTHMQIKALDFLGHYSFMAKPLATTLRCIVELCSVTRDGTKERIWRRRQMQKAGIIPPDVVGTKEDYDPVMEDAAMFAKSSSVAANLVSDVSAAAALAINGDPLLYGAEPVHLIDDFPAADALKMHGPFQDPGDFKVEPPPPEFTTNGDENVTGFFASSMSGVDSGFIPSSVLSGFSDLSVTKNPLPNALFSPEMLPPNLPSMSSFTSLMNMTFPPSLDTVSTPP